MHIQYWGSNNAPDPDPVWERCYTIDDRGCMYTNIVRRDYRNNPIDRRDYHAEHFIEIRTVGDFTVWAIQSGHVPPSFFTHTMLQHLAAGANGRPPVTAGGEDLWVPAYRIMNALGSTLNERNFMMLLDGLNTMKAKVTRTILNIFPSFLLW